MSKTLTEKTNRRSDFFAMGNVRFKKIYVEITNSCNFHCSFCYRRKRKNTFLTVGQFAEIAEKIAPHTDYVYLHVLGEPLLHPHLNEILSILEKFHLFTNITTNGSLLLHQKELLQKHAVRQLNISLHDWEENMPNSINLMRKTIEFAKVLSGKTYICFRLWNITSETPSAFNQTCLSLLEQELNISAIAPKITSGNGISLAPNIFLQQERRFVWPSADGIPTETSRACRALRDHIAILSDGTVVPCCLDAEGHLALGNIFENSIDELFRTERAQRMLNGFRQNRATENFCKTYGF